MSSNQKTEKKDAPITKETTSVPLPSKEEPQKKDNIITEEAPKNENKITFEVPDHTESDLINAFENLKIGTNEANNNENRNIPEKPIEPQPEPEPEPEISEEKFKEISKKKYDKFISLLKSNSFKKIVFMVGAGISTTSGIPDFRSKDGIFHRLKEKYKMERPEDVFELEKFYENPKFFNEFAREFLSKNYTPTKFHYFMSFLSNKKLVKYVFTQNIDCLEAKSIVDQKKVIYAHGNFLSAHCPRCKTSLDYFKFNQKFMKGTDVNCKKCKGPCKYNIVFYGERLNQTFFPAQEDIKDADLAIVCGTSLQVFPFSMLPQYVGDKCWRVVVDINKIRPNLFTYADENSRDLYIGEKSDEFVMNVLKDCKWKFEFEKFVEDIKKKLGRNKYFK